MRQASKKLRDILADNVRALRFEQGISQEELAGHCDLHRTYIGSIERSERNVTLSTLEVLTHALGVPVAKLLTKRVPGNGK